MTMTATEENVKHDQSLVDILARCVMLLGILVAQGQKGGPLTMREYVQAQLDMLQVTERSHAMHQGGRPRMERPRRLQRATGGRSKRHLLRNVPGSLISG